MTVINYVLPKTDCLRAYLTVERVVERRQSVTVERYVYVLHRAEAAD